MDPRTEDDDQRNTESEFASAASAPAPGLLREFWDFLRENKKWWLIPIILALLLVGLIIVLGSSAAAPFIYPFF